VPREIERRMTRLAFRERFALMLARDFPQWSVAEVSAETNLEASLSPAYVRAFLRRGCDVTKQLLRERMFEHTPALISGAGSAWYDVVAEEFAAAGFGDAAEIVLRPGCYLTHDVGNYETQQQRILESNPVARNMRSGLVPAALGLTIQRRRRRAESDIDDLHSGRRSRVSTMFISFDYARICTAELLSGVSSRRRASTAHVAARAPWPQAARHAAGSARTHGPRLLH